MHRKKPFSGKQKKQQLKDNKFRKKDGPSYLADDSEEEADKKLSKVPRVGGKARETAAEPTGFVSQLQVLKVHEQPRRGDGTKLDTNSFRLHFLKESEEEVARRKREARKPIVPFEENQIVYKVEDVFPVDAKLNFPKRPPWSYRQSKEALEGQEREYFKRYVSDILDQPRALDLSYFEVNLETWRQLWRVLEISDILLIIADIRYPVVHLPPSLITYILHDLHKDIIIILNKVDYVPTVLALSWQQYLQTAFPGIHVVFFSSFPRDKHPDDDPVNFDPSTSLYKRPFRGKRALPVGPTQLLNVIREIVQGKADLSSWETKIAFDASSDPADEADQSESPPDDGAASGADVSHETHDEQEYVKYKDGVVTIGCIGYPNVGKSSVLNSLVGKKVVSVSKTPGHTKHLQTIFLCPTVRLCDCPGLVFPSMVPRSLQVIAGIFPVAQVKEPYSVVGYLAQRLNLPKLLKLTHPSCEDQGHAGDFAWTSFDICEAWAVKCGFTTSRVGRPDTYRAANKILRLAAEGQLCLCFRPPNYSDHSKKLMSDPETSQLLDLFGRRLRSNSSNNQAWDGQEDKDDGSEEEETEDEEEEGGIPAQRGMFAELQGLDADSELS